MLLLLKILRYEDWVNLIYLRLKIVIQKHTHTPLTIAQLCTVYHKHTHMCTDTYNPSLNSIWEYSNRKMRKSETEKQMSYNPIPQL